ncbi:hypothetical protein BJP36_37200 [Moorena producens JHB]|uniref:Uncharacterized protein n=1 Tax=Moorena producens (strain JHB) TaxID=1454205 RepID=A0A9Q9SU88_MOOP1|nr:MULTISPECIES: hypothetical protein [Moorena]WAN69731.1 hypothetical protein BJP36_37200 [Moorena producens JHB]
MANIQISNLRPAGADLFLDSESYMHDLTEQEMMNTLGGVKVEILWTALCVEW